MVIRMMVCAMAKSFSSISCSSFLFPSRAVFKAKRTVPLADCKPCSSSATSLSNFWYGLFPYASDILEISPTGFPFNNIWESLNVTLAEVVMPSRWTK